MFYYFGRKKQTAKNYPLPLFTTIVEPFAGSASYSLHGENWKREIIIIDNNPVVIGIWNYLLSASVSDIESLPNLQIGENVDNFKYLSNEEKNLIGLHINPGSSVPKKTTTKFSRWRPGKEYIVKNLFKIKHWKFLPGSCFEHSELLKKTSATYFIDPPYYGQGKQYAGGNSNLDYEKLSEFILSLTGQVIVCEGADHNNWLPFKELNIVVNNGGMNGGKKSKEYIYYVTQKKRNLYEKTITHFPTTTANIPCAALKLL